MQNIKLKKLLPHLIAIFLFLALSVVYFAPAAFDQKGLPQADVTSVQGWQKELKDYHQATGDYAFWSNSMFGGGPANINHYMRPVVSLFSYFGTILTLNLNLLHLGILFLYLICFYIFLLCIGCKPWLSIVGAIAYSLASYNIIIIEAGHINKALAMATMAPIIGGVILAYRKKYVLGALVTLIFTGLNIAYNHQQISYYLLLILIILAIVYFIFAWRQKEIKSFFISSAILISVSALAVLPNLGNLIPTYDFSKETMRGGNELKHNLNGGKESSGLDIDYAYQWSYGRMESFTLLIPNFNGANSHYPIGKNSETYKAYKDESIAKYAPTYWGDQPFTSGPVYAGAIICFLFILGLFIVKGPEKWWILGATILSLILAWGRNFMGFNEFMFEYAPFYNKFRTPAMALIMAGVTMPLLAVLAVKELLDNTKKSKELFKDALYSFYITGGICLFFVLFSGSFFSFLGPADAGLQQSGWPDWLLDALRADRKSMLVDDALRSLILILLALGGIWMFIKNKIKANTFILLLGILILFDLWQVDKRFLNDSKFVPKKKAKEIAMTDADRQILQDTDLHYRVFNATVNTFNDATTSYYHKSIGGYSPVKLRRYQDIIDYHFSRGMNVNVLNMLNTKYFIAPTDRGAQVQQNVAALGNAWFVNDIIWVNTPDEEIRALYNYAHSDTVDLGSGVQVYNFEAFNPADQVVIDKVWSSSVSEFVSGSRDSNGTIKLLEYQPGYLKYTSSTTSTQLAVFSEIFYDKTWKAFIDGKEVPHFRVNYILRGMEIPAGNHVVEFKCEDELFNQSARLALYSSIFVGLVILGLLFLQFKKRNQ